jgi:hypothetical protein
MVSRESWNRLPALASLHMRASDNRDDGDAFVLAAIRRVLTATSKPSPRS